MELCQRANYEETKPVLGTECCSGYWAWQQRRLQQHTSYTTLIAWCRNCCSHNFQAPHDWNMLIRCSVRRTPVVRVCFGRNFGRNTAFSGTRIRLTSAGIAESWGKTRRNTSNLAKNSPKTHAVSHNPFFRAAPFRGFPIPREREKLPASMGSGCMGSEVSIGVTHSPQSLHCPFEFFL